MFFFRHTFHKQLRTLMIISFSIFLSCESYTIRSFVEKQKADIDFSHIVLNYKFDFADLQSKNLKKPIISSLKQMNFKDINEINQLSHDNYNFEIQVKYLGPLGTSIAVLSIVTLGIVPTYLSEHDMYGIRLVLYKGLKPLYDKEYVLRMKQFNWIFVAPAGIGNKCRREKIIDVIVDDFF